MEEDASVDGSGRSSQRDARCPDVTRCRNFVLKCFCLNDMKDVMAVRDADCIFASCEDRWFALAM